MFIPRLRQKNFLDQLRVTPVYLYKPRVQGSSGAHWRVQEWMDEAKTKDSGEKGWLDTPGTEVRPPYIQAQIRHSTWCERPPANVLASTGLFCPSSLGLAPMLSPDTISNKPTAGYRCKKELWNAVPQKKELALGGFWTLSFLWPF